MLFYLHLLQRMVSFVDNAMEDVTIFIIDIGSKHYAIRKNSP